MKHLRFKHLIPVLVFSILTMCIIPLFSRKGNKQIQKSEHGITGLHVYKLDPKAFLQKKKEAFLQGNGKSAHTITLYYWLARLNHDGQTGNRWCFIAAKLEDPHGLHNWWALGLNKTSVFALTEDEANQSPKDEYDYYMRLISALLHNDEETAAVHLKRLRELGVSEKLLENPLTLPSMEEEP